MIGANWMRTTVRVTARGAIVAKLLAVGAMFTAAAASAQESGGEALAAMKRCYACHDMERVLLGPPYRAIAVRHASSERDVMIEVLAQKIIHGGAGNWGIVPMVPNEHVTLRDARAISEWILRLNDE